MSLEGAVCDAFERFVERLHALEQKMDDVAAAAETARRDAQLAAQLAAQRDAQVSAVLATIPQNASSLEQPYVPRR
jgi:hypothetical protein